MRPQRMIVIGLTLDLLFRLGRTIDKAQPESGNRLIVPLSILVVDYFILFLRQGNGESRKFKHLQKGLNYFQNNKEILSRFCFSDAKVKLTSNPLKLCLEKGSTMRFSVLCSNQLSYLNNFFHKVQVLEYDDQRGCNCAEYVLLGYRQITWQIYRFIYRIR